MRLYARLLLAALVSLTLAASTTTAVLSPAQSATWAPRVAKAFDPRSDRDQFESRILVQINRARARHGLSRVKVFQSCVDGYAERWSRRLKRHDDLFHRDLTSVIRGCDLNWVGETLVSGTGLTPASAVRAWLNSPPHRAVLLKDRARWAGVGVRVNEAGRVFAVLNFGDRT
ncbi:MAG TPA: CAP domain-containing protein [Nocardioides sp.]|nr:CAP domain-containing protein [Nocardioides sp.]